LASNLKFRVAPTILSFSPTSGPVDTSVVITGKSFTGATSVAFGGVKASSFEVDSYTQVTATVPSGAKTGKISVTTAGGTVTSTGTFTVP
jgi:IPT/TIG domain